MSCSFSPVEHREIQQKFVCTKQTISRKHRATLMRVDNFHGKGIKIKLWSSHELLQTRSLITNTRKKIRAKWFHLRTLPRLASSFAVRWRDNHRRTLTRFSPGNTSWQGTRGQKAESIYFTRLANPWMRIVSTRRSGQGVWGESRGEVTRGSRLWELIKDDQLVKLISTR